AQRAAIHIGSSPAERQVNNVIQDEALPQVEIRVAALGTKVERVARKTMFVRTRLQRIGCIVDGMGPGIGGLELYSAVEAAREFCLQRMISRIRCRLQQRWL